MAGGSAKNRILALVKGTHPLIIGNSLSSQEIHKETSTLRGVFGGLVILAHPRFMILVYNPAEVSDLSSS